MTRSFRIISSLLPQDLLLRLSGIGVAVSSAEDAFAVSTPPGGHYARQRRTKRIGSSAGLHCQTGHGTEKRLNQHSSYSEDGQGEFEQVPYHNTERAAISVSVGTSVPAHLLGL
jgi:hypothetical protein